MFGLSPDYILYCNAKADLGILEGKFSVTQDRMMITWIRLAKEKLASLGNVKVENNYKTKNAIEVTLGIPRIDPKEIMTIEYYNLIEIAQKKNKDGRGS